MEDDIISTLPDDVLCHILSFLPIRDYVATSILSRKWKRVSTLVPSHISSHHLPTALVMTLDQGSTVNTMDFHPLQHFWLLAGTNTGDITIWEVGKRQRLVSRNFKVWDIKACSTTLQTVLANDYTASVNRVIWSPDGALFDTKPDEVEKSKAWKLTEFNEPSQLCSLRLPDYLSPVKIIVLTYTHLGGGILALASNAVHKFWKWQTSDGKATSSVPPQLRQLPSGILMTNDTSDTRLEHAIPCFALTKNDSYLLSTSGGNFSLFNIATFKKITTFMSPSPAATSVAFNPHDNNIVVIGTDDSFIYIYNIRVDEVKNKLKGHQNRVTGLTFSNMLNVLVSSGGDAQLCLWSMDGWEKHTSKFLWIPPGRVSSPLARTHVQFHQDQIHVLAVHETQIAIYEAPMLDCLKQWFPPESSGSVTDATYSCDGQLIYASIEDVSVCVLTAFTLQLRSRISPAAYLSSNPSSRAYPLVIAAHPSKPNQFAIGLTDGGVHVIETPESEGSWRVAPVLENGVVPSANSDAGSG
ncbi:hypothetical protein SO802_005836 [Lithocarpus litseifolius]|uniref:F-box domain-containing protein n=1 Tax=Lithocarpus litseifolius TaxID=425828 RepID=A0AAW2DJ99_9ROSI